MSKNPQAGAIAALDDRTAEYTAQLASLGSVRRVADDAVRGLADGTGPSNDHSAHAVAHDARLQAVANQTRVENLRDAAQLAALVLRVAPNLAEIRAQADEVCAAVDAASERVMGLAQKSPLRSQLDAIRHASVCAAAVEQYAVPAALKLAAADA